MSDDRQDPTLARVRDLEQALLATRHMLEKTRTEREAFRAELEKTRADLVRTAEERNAAKDARRALEFELGLVRDGGTQVVEDLKHVAEALDAAEVPKVALVGGARLTLAERVKLLDCRAEVAGLRAERDELQRTVDAALVDHSAVESARAQLAREVEALKAQLAALAAEHEGVAKAAERNKQLSDALCAPDAAGRGLPELLRDAAQACRSAGGGPLEDCLQLKAEELGAALAEVTP